MLNSSRLLTPRHHIPYSGLSQRKAGEIGYCHGVKSYIICGTRLKACFLFQHYRYDNYTYMMRCY